jgi:protein SCO1
MKTTSFTIARAIAQQGLVYLAVSLMGASLAHAHGLADHTNAAKGQGGAVAASSLGYKRSVNAYAMPDVVLTDADERKVKLRDLMASSDPVMVNFIFTSCSTICPVMSHVFSELPGVLGADGKRLRMVSISIDPEADTPLQLKAYAKSLHAGDRWKFLTGSIEDIKLVQLAFGAFRGSKMNHEPLTLMRQTAGDAWVRIDGFAAPDALAREYRKMLSL